MTEEEVRRFALQLREAERLRAQIAEDEAAWADSGDELPLRLREWSSRVAPRPQVSRGTAIPRRP